MVNINFERINTCYKNINSEVKLEVVDKKRILDIALNTQLRLLVWNLTNLVYHLDSHATEEVGRFDDPEHVRVSGHVSTEFLPVIGSESQTAPL